MKMETPGPQITPYKTLVENMDKTFTDPSILQLLQTQNITIGQNTP